MLFQMAPWLRHNGEVVNIAARPRKPRSPREICVSHRAGAGGGHLDRTWLPHRWNETPAGAARLRALPNAAGGGVGAWSIWPPGYARGQVDRSARRLAATVMLRMRNKN